MIFSLKLRHTQDLMNNRQISRQHWIIGYIYCAKDIFQWHLPVAYDRSKHWKISIKKPFFKTFTIFTRKHLCWGLLLVTLQASRSAKLKNGVHFSRVQIISRGKKLFTSKKFVTFHWRNFTHHSKSKSFIYFLEILFWKEKIN